MTQQTTNSLLLREPHCKNDLQKKRPCPQGFPERNITLVSTRVPLGGSMSRHIRPGRVIVFESKTAYLSFEVNVLPGLFVELVCFQQQSEDVVCWIAVGFQVFRRDIWPFTPQLKKKKRSALGNYKKLTTFQSIWIRVFISIHITKGPRSCGRNDSVQWDFIGWLNRKLWLA